MKQRIKTVLVGFLTVVTAAQAQPRVTLDLATPLPAGALSRVYGSTGTGRFGVPVAGGSDVDGDGFADVAVAYFTASPLERLRAGEIDLVFGDGTIGGTLDTALDQPGLLRIFGAGPQETAGNEIWIDDVTGDGIADLLIGRQNHTPDTERIGAGALTIVTGGPELRRLALEGSVIDLAQPPDEITMTTVVGAQAIDRLGIWMRTGDIDGDGIADIVVGADQEDAAGGDEPAEENRGAVYVIRGGAHLSEHPIVDLASFAASPLAGHLAKITPPKGSSRFHFGATCTLADLDGNGRAEVLAAAALLRAGAQIRADGAPIFSAESAGGSLEGTVFIAWDDNFPDEPWPAGLSFDVTQAPGSHTVLDGESRNRAFGEEILGGLDFDGDARADLFVGDLVGGEAAGRARPGSGHIFYDAARLKGRQLDFDDLPSDLRTTTILGPSTDALASDTAAQGDFDGDGWTDLAIASPHAHPLGRFRAGVFQVFYGRPGGWPVFIDSAAENLPLPDVLRVTEVQGARGQAGPDFGDTLGYSATAADMNGDGRTDLISNEMLGNGFAPEAIDHGNLIVLDGAALSGMCRDTSTVLCVNEERFAVTIEWRDFNGLTGSGRVVDAQSDDSGIFWFFDSENWEVLVKVLDGCATNGHFWVFAAATTNVEYTLRVEDALTGQVVSYFNPLGTSAAAVTDTTALDSCP